MPLQRKILINPEHPEFDRVKIDTLIPLEFDPGIQTRGGRLSAPVPHRSDPA
jgi:hypothetical protein